MGNIKFTVNIVWKEKDTNKERPLIGPKVEICYKRLLKTASLGWGYLNDNGSVEINFNNKNDLLTFDKKVKLTIKIWPDTRHATVYRTIGCLYCADFTREYSGNNMTIKHVVDQANGEREKRLVIAEVLEFAARFVSDKLGEAPQHVNCMYPAATCGGACYSAMEGIYIHKDSFDSYRTIIHEYTHQIQRWFKLLDVLPGFMHLDNQDLTAKYTKGKGIYTALLEGHADYLPSRVKSAFSSQLDFVGYKNYDTNRPDKVWVDGYKKAYSGEGCEDTVARIFYDLTDDNAEILSEESNLLNTQENIKISDQMLFAVIKQLRVKYKLGEANLYLFTKMFCEYFPALKEEFNNILTIQKVAPHNVTIKSTNNAIKVEWTPGGQKESEYCKGLSYENIGTKKAETYQTKYVVSVYDANSRLVFKSEELKNPSYTIENDAIKLAKSKGNYILIKVLGKNTQSPATEYESAYYKYDLPSDKGISSSMTQGKPSIKIRTAIKTQLKK